MGKHVMIDLETWGTQDGSIIISLGAVKFDPQTNDDLTEDNFYCAIDPKSSEQFGLKADAATLLWWMDPDRAEARAAWLSDTKVDLPTMLEGFQDWYGSISLPTWGNGATFDNVLLRTAYVRGGMDCPWNFWDDRCFRTLKNLTNVPAQTKPVMPHEALADALYQAQWLRNIVRALALNL